MTRSMSNATSCLRWAKVKVVQSRLRASAKGLDALGQGGNIDMLLGLGIELSQLLRQALLGLGHLLSFPLELVTLEHLCQVEIEQPSLLPFELRQDITQRLSSSLQGLG